MIVNKFSFIYFYFSVMKSYWDRKSFWFYYILLCGDFLRFSFHVKIFCHLILQFDLLPIFSSFVSSLNGITQSPHLSATCPGYGRRGNNNIQLKDEAAPKTLAKYIFYLHVFKNRQGRDFYRKLRFKSSFNLNMFFPISQHT